MTDLFSSTKKIMCPDGRPRLILKKPEKAFSIYFPNWSVRISEIVSFYTQFQVSANQEVVKKTASIVKDLTENYAALQAHYQAAYLGYCGNPCSEEAERRYNEATDLIRKKDLELRKIEINSGFAGKRGKVMFRKVPTSKKPAQRRYRSKERGDTSISSDSELNESNAQIQEVESRIGDRSTYSLDAITPLDNLDKIQKLVAQLKI